MNNFFTGCFENFAVINGMHNEKFKFIKTHFYRKVSALRQNCATSSTKQLVIEQKNKHKYKKVTIPKLNSRITRFQQKGIILIWMQKRKLWRNEKLTYLAWLLSQTFFILYILNILPCGAVLPLEPPLWKDKPLLVKPVQDYIIEPDWDS